MKQGLNKLIVPINTHYNWATTSGDLYKFYNSDMNCEISFGFDTVKLSSFLNKREKILNIIKLKNKTGLVKTDFDFKKAVLNKIISASKSNISINKRHEISNINAKAYDFKKNLRKYLNNNKKYLSIIFKRKFHNNITYSKYVKNFSKNSSYYRIHHSEMNVKNVLSRSGFFFNLNDLNKYFLEGCVYLNGLSCSKNALAKVNDIIHIEFDEDYYRYYRGGYSDSGFIINFLKNSVRKSNFNRFKSTNVSSKLKNYLNYNEDVPSFMEVDYLTMSCIIVREPTKLEDYNSLNLNFINLYLGRVYNWKFIT